MNIAFIPARGGSKGIHLKNVRNVAGVPLLQHSLYTLENVKEIDLIVVATDSHEIRECAKVFGSTKMLIFDRDPANAQDDSGTEDVMLEYFGQHSYHSDDRIFLVQCTNPFLKEEHVKEADLMMDHYDSVVTVTRDHRFVWEKGKGVANYDPLYRPRRQDWPGIYMENGAMYVCTIGGLHEHKCRLHGNISTLVMDGKHTQIEIDEMEDLIVAEALLRREGQRLAKVRERSRSFYKD